MATVRTFNRAKLMITFAHITMCGSISAAAAQLRIDKGAVSRQLRELEELLDARLMHRSTRRMVLTEVGALVYERALRVIEEVEHAEMDAQALRSQPCGVLTVSASVAFGRMHVVPLLPEFMRMYPEIEVQLCLLDRHTDLVEEGMDVLLRLSDTAPDHLVAHHLCDIDYAVVASPELARTNPPINSPADLRTHGGLFYGFKSRTSTWCFQRAGKIHSVPMATRVSVNNSESIRELALRGVGIAMLPCFAIAADLRAGTLRRLLPDYEALGQLGGKLYALHLPGRSNTPKIGCFVDFVRKRWMAGNVDRWG